MQRLCISLSDGSMVPIEAPDVRSAWASAMRLLLDSTPRYSLVLSIRDPCGIPEHDLLPLDPHNYDRNENRLLDVAATIFPRRRPNDPLDFGEFIQTKARAY